MASVSINSSRWQTEIPAVVVNLVGSYFDSSSMIAALQVCKTWNKDLRICRENLYSQRIGYPSEMVKALASRFRSLWRLPVLDLTGMSSFLDLKGDLLYPLMRFRTNDGRLGLAIKVSRKIESTLERNRNHILITLFERRPYKPNEEASSWQIWSENEAGFHSLYEKVVCPKGPHGFSLSNRPCKVCLPFIFGNGISWFVSFIQKTDLALEMREDISQVQDPLPFSIPVRFHPDSERSPLATPLSFPRRIWNLFWRGFLWVASIIGRFFRR